MDSFKSYLFREEYKKIRKLGDRLAKIEPLIDWDAFRPIVQCLYDNRSPRGGRPPRNPLGLLRAFIVMRMKAIRSLRELARLLDVDPRLRRLYLIGDTRELITNYKVTIILCLYLQCLISLQKMLKNESI